LFTPDILPPLRVPADRLKRQGELERAVDLAARKLAGEGGVFILIDCDWDDGCPRWDGPELLRRAQQARPDVPVSVVLAYREYESWFIAAAESIRGKHGLSETLEVVTDPESIRGAKEWLSRRMSRNTSYAPTSDQSALTQLFDMDMARQRAGSFDKCYREIIGLLNKLSAELS
jgi:hypothetical protein